MNVATFSLWKTLKLVRIHEVSRLIRPWSNCNTAKCILMRLVLGEGGCKNTPGFNWQPLSSENHKATLVAVYVTTLSCLNTYSIIIVNNYTISINSQSRQKLHYDYSLLRAQICLCRDKVLIVCFLCIIVTQCHYKPSLWQLSANEIV